MTVRFVLTPWAATYSAPPVAGSGEGHFRAFGDTTDPLTPWHIRGQLIALVGIDGSGKTSQALELAKWLVSRGESAMFYKSVSVKNEFDAIALRIGRQDRFDLLGAHEATIATASVRWKSILSLRGLLEQAGTSVIIDRYSYCELAASRVYSPRSEALLRQMFSTLPRPHLTLWLDVPPDVAVGRMVARGTEPEPIHVLQELRAAYQGLPESGAFVRVDASVSFEAVQQKLRELVQGCYE